MKAKQKMTLFEAKTLEKLEEIVERLNILIELSVPLLKTEGWARLKRRFLSCAT